MKKLFILLSFLFSLMSFAQTGIIRGTITDKQSEKSIAGATVELVNDSNSSLTDENGNFALTNVPLGRQTIRISFLGFENTTVPDIDVTSGKEVVVVVSLTESFNVLEEVVIASDRNNKARSINKLAAVSARQFSPEEVNRYAGGRSDVARLAPNFAGVATADDSRNDIVVRGNSPTGLLWRLEGIPIPSPNHFSTLGTTGSPVSALNPNLLANSDFITSAFPAGYGNAIGGVFDLGLRKGQQYYITMHDDEHQICAEEAAKCFVNPERLFPAMIRKHDGRGGYVFTQWEYKAMFDENSNPSGIFCIGFDITTYELEKLLLRTAETDNDRKAAARQKITFQQSHLVRAPLSNILGLAAVLEKSDADVNISHLCKLIFESARKLDDVVREIGGTAFEE